MLSIRFYVKMACHSLAISLVRQPSGGEVEHVRHSALDNGAEALWPFVAKPALLAQIMSLCARELVARNPYVFALD